MTPVELLKLISQELLKEQCQFAVCGGIAASIYRKDFRTTNDLDIAINFPQDKSDRAEQRFSMSFLERLGYETALGWAPGIATGDESNVFFVIGRSKGSIPQIDFLLPSLPWVRQAVKRAQFNRVDFGFAKLPTVTPEDVLISKAFALKFDPQRATDRDDIRSVLEEGVVLDMTYVEENFAALKLNTKLLSK